MRPRSKTLLSGLTALLVCSATAACGGGSSEASDGVVYVSYGGSFQEAETRAWLDDYAKEAGVTVTQDQPIDLAKLKAMQEAGSVTWDVVSTGDADPVDNKKTFEPIDCEIVACDDFIDSANFDGYRAPYYTWATALTYNTNAFDGDAPQSWADFFDLKKFPGKRTLWSGVTADTLEPALLADGVAPEDLYPLDVDRALKKLDSIKDSIIWHETGAQCTQLLASEEAVMGNCWNGRAYDAAEAGDPVSVQWNQCFLLIGALAVPKGSPNVEGAMELVAHITSSENNAKLSEEIAYGPTNVGALDDVSEDIKPYLATSYQDQCISVDRSWLVENGADAQQRLQAWMSK
jgi:putative spermidine/putrescine transport system substrate-binding protein